MKARKALSVGFWSGMSLHAVVTGIREDIMGPERLIRHLQYDWVPTRVSLPIELALLVLVLGGLVFARLQTEEP